MVQRTFCSVVQSLWSKDYITKLVLCKTREIFRTTTEYRLRQSKIKLSMPPKRKIPKTEENTNVIEETTNSAKAIKKAAKNVTEEPSRTLRPRKTPTPPKPTTTKEKSVKTAEKETNTKKKTAKAKQGSKEKTAENSDNEAPAAKQSKLSIIEQETENGADDEPANAMSIYDFTAKDINGKLVSLEKYKGHVCIIVNVASRCGHTSSNYKEFVEIYDKYNENKGLRILAFPCNQFGKQEPGDNEKICEFAKKRNVTFDLFEKIDVNGKNAHPLWKYLTSQEDGPKGSKIDWNFTKFLINKEGQVVERFKPSVKPSALVKELEKLW